jgi:hypothetical protein
LKYADPSGHWFETAIDIASLIWSIVEFSNDPSWANAGYIGLDIVTIVVPIAPAGGAIGRAVAHGDDVADAIKGLGKQADSIIDIGKNAPDVVDNIVDTTKYTSNNFRKNLQQSMNLSDEAVKGKEAHHMLPQQFEDEFKKAVPDINIHDPKYGVFMDDQLHHLDHYQYNQEWKDFLKTNPDASLRQIETQAQKLMAEFYGLLVSFK